MQMREGGTGGGWGWKGWMGGGWGVEDEVWKGWVGGGWGWKGGWEMGRGGNNGWAGAQGEEGPHSPRRRAKACGCPVSLTCHSRLLLISSPPSWPRGPLAIRRRPCPRRGRLRTADPAVASVMYLSCRREVCWDPEDAVVVPSAASLFSCHLRPPVGDIFEAI